jgi:hypothetical protein
MKRIDPFLIFVYGKLISERCNLDETNATAAALPQLEALPTTSIQPKKDRPGAPE